MVTKLNDNIKILENNSILNSKASETYVSVIFSYNNSEWEGYVPIEYRRTGISIDFEDKDSLYKYLNNIYEELNPNNFQKWKSDQIEFWETKSKAFTTKSFFDVLAEGGWKCGNCKI